MLADRIDAEMAFAIRLDKIGEEKYTKSFSIGVIADAVQSFKQSCVAKARQAAELCDNTH
jgi:hypothetical protein